jgi:phosphate transport system substrate-binding protein
MKSSKRKISLAVAFVISGFGATAAMAQVTTPLLGGGSTLVQPTINQEAQGLTITYFGVGSGAGQTAFLTDSSAALGTTAGQTVHFANSDAPLSTAQITAYSATGGRAATDGPLIQIPYITTPITIPVVNGPVGTGPALGGTATVALDDNDLCGVFSGKFSNWNQLHNAVDGSAITLNTKLWVVYRADASGTTDLLTAHLAAVCNGNPNTATGVTFQETQHFANATDAIFPNGAPTNFIAETGSGAVATRLVNLRTAGTAAVAYLSPDYTNTSLAAQSPNAQANQLAVASVKNATSGAIVLPTSANAATAVGTGTLPTDFSDQNQWVPRTPNPSVGYPISGTSQIIVSQCYKSAAATSSIVNFLDAHYADSNATLLAGNGFAAAPSTLLSEIKQVFLTAGDHNGLDIGDASCGTKGR